MKRLAIVIGIVVILLVSGGLTAQILIGGDSLIIQQSEIPDASVLSAAPWQSEQLVLFIGFIVFNLVGMAATVAVVMWFLHRGVKQTEAEKK